MAELLERHDELATTPQLLGQLERVSVSTVGRRLARIRQDEPRLPRKGPKQANTLTRDIPMMRIPWDEQQPGHFEVDLVHHSGPSAAGEFVCTVQMIDVATGWSERAAVLGRSYRVMDHAFRRMLRRLPFPVRQIHPDNGTEFFNHHMLRFWKDLVQGVSLSRSRPHHKNDNRFVEQKNDTLVRAYVGYERLDTVALYRTALSLSGQDKGPVR
jgi:IS30 family transposase